MLIDQFNTKEAWLKLRAAFKAASAPQYVPEYHHECERSLNNRYYR